MAGLQLETEQWYEWYYRRKGMYRNDVIFNRGVLFQKLAFEKSIIEALRTIGINRDWKVLDVGCGSGGSLIQFLDLGFNPNNLYGIDIIPNNIENAKEKLCNVQFECGNAAQMDYKSDYFDIVTESTMFMQITDNNLSQKIANEMLRVVKPSGYIMLIDWRYNFRKPEYKPLSKTRVAELFKTGIKTKLHCYNHGALIPPVGRFLSARLSPIYFLVQSFLPILSAQITIILKKR
jgi:ubiquinone/menaquinone biosynthesis C-methylase UbiE